MCYFIVYDDLCQRLDLTRLDLSYPIASGRFLTVPQKTGTGGIRATFDASRSAFVK